MLLHVAVFRWNAGTTPDQVEALSRGLAALPGVIPEIRRYRFGPDAALAEGNHDFAVVAELDDAEAYRRYAEHPAHRELIASLLRPLLGTRSAVQVVVEEDG